jgi:hypothetical protein
MAIQNFTRDDVRFVNNGSIIYNGCERVRWEARRETSDGHSTYTEAHFLASPRATRDEVARTYQEYMVA